MGVQGLQRLPAGRRTNLALLALLAASLATGALAFGIGSGWVRWAVVAHGVAGLAILALSPWKSAISARGLRKRRPGSWASVALSALVVIVVLTGIGHATGVLRSLGSLTAMQLHVGAALAAIPLALWHVAARPVRPRRTDLSRRSLLRTGALAGGTALGYAAVEGLAALASLPGSQRRPTGSYERGSFDPDSMPVTQWLNDAVPTVDSDAWALTVRTRAGERSFSYEELAAFHNPLRATVDCTGGWFAEQEWEGVWLSTVLKGAQPARSIEVASVTGYGRRFPSRDADGLLLAMRVGGEPLSPGHGFPARLVAPSRRGFWWVKWVSRIELSDTPWWWQSPFPLT